MLDQVNDLHDWYHVDADGRPWMMVSFDVVRDSGVETAGGRTLPI
jgi:hypothetical protein